AAGGGEDAAGASGGGGGAPRSPPGGGPASPPPRRPPRWHSRPPPPFRREPVWTFRARALLEFPPVIAYDRIYIVNNAGTVFALNQGTGKVLWKYRSHRCSAASPAVGNHLVFVSLLYKPPCNASHGGDGQAIA